MSIPRLVARVHRPVRRRRPFLRNGTELFAATSWVQVMFGQGIAPRDYHPAVDWVSDADLRSLVETVEKLIARCVSIMPRHEDFIARHCAAV